MEIACSKRLMAALTLEGARPLSLAARRMPPSRSTASTITIVAKSIRRSFCQTSGTMRRWHVHDYALPVPDLGYSTSGR
ncbi:hypothetical protein N183_03665 [Sinorhizobium sp. Sb3]|nr:hypothetical protein N183_03665 [Sinorhizobium sp. Sb3]